jgi:hypothetical protein
MKPIRQTTEMINQRFKGQFDLERHSGHTHWRHLAWRALRHIVVTQLLIVIPSQVGVRGRMRRSWLMAGGTNGTKQAGFVAWLVTFLVPPAVAGGWWLVAGTAVCCPPSGMGRCHRRGIRGRGGNRRVFCRSRPRCLVTLAGAPRRQDRFSLQRKAALRAAVPRVRLRSVRFMDQKDLEGQVTPAGPA